VNILMVSPHLPPHQAANALLPHLLGHALAERGHGVRYLTFGETKDTESVRYVRRRRGPRVTRLPQALEAFDTWRKCRSLVRASDVVHVHSNTWMNQVAARVAVRERRPYVLTHYGTEIWHHDGRDPRFRRLNAQAAHVAFYSQALLERGRALGVPLRRASVVYPPVADAFRPPEPLARAEVRRRHARDASLLLLNVKRLHPLADHASLLLAMARVAEGRADAQLLIAGSGECEAALKAETQRLGLEGRVRFLGLVPNDEVARLQGAADLFVLSSELEATPTVALEALACGTPVVSTDSPGGLELQALFGDDVRVVPRKDPDALARAILEFAAAPRRARQASAGVVESRFRVAGVAERYLALYSEAAS
jgi:glycosyltransferase involved in cell wall biosynthesis